MENSIIFPLCTMNGKGLTNMVPLFICAAVCGFEMVFHCSVVFYSNKFRLLSLCKTDLEGVSTMGELVRWRSPELLSDIFKPIFKRQIFTMLQIK